MLSFHIPSICLCFLPYLMKPYLFSKALFKCRFFCEDFLGWTELITFLRVTLHIHTNNWIHNTIHYIVGILLKALFPYPFANLQRLRPYLIHPYIHSASQCWMLENANISTCILVLSSISLELVASKDRHLNVFLTGNFKNSKVKTHYCFSAATEILEDEVKSHPQSCCLIWFVFFWYFPF